MVTRTEYLIIGAGPAGLQLAALLERGGHDYTVLERGSAPGTFFTRFPRHRQLISINKVNTGYDDPELRMRMDWNSLLSDNPDLLFTRYSERYFPQADDLVRYLADFAAATGVRVNYDTDVVRISRDGNGFTAVDHNGQSWRSERLIVATGVSELYVAPIPGIEHAERYDTFDTDPQSFTGQRVLIIGKGNSAFETADALVEKAAVIHVAGPHSIRMAWQSHFVGHLRAVNNNFLDTYQLKSQNTVLDGTVENIERTPDGRYRVMFRYSRTVEKLRELHYDRVIACTGFRFDASVFDDSCRPALVIKDRFPEQTPAYESANVPGLYFAGTLTQQRDFKKSTSGFIHGFRYGVRALYRIHHGENWPAATVEPTQDAISDAILARVNVSSALWQQFSVLGDVVTVDGDTALYQEEVPITYVADGGLGPARHRFVVNLEYGAGHDNVDPFDISVSRPAENDATNAHDSAYLHPVVRYYRDGEPAGHPPPRGESGEPLGSAGSAPAAAGHLRQGMPCLTRIRSPCWTSSPRRDSDRCSSTGRHHRQCEPVLRGPDRADPGHSPGRRRGVRARRPGRRHRRSSARVRGPGRRPAPDYAALRTLVADQLGEACVPATITVIDEPPLAPSGKPDKRRLLAEAGRHTESRRSGAGPGPAGTTP